MGVSMSKYRMYQCSVCTAAEIRLKPFGLGTSCEECNESIHLCNECMIDQKGGSSTLCCFCKDKKRKKTDAKKRCRCKKTSKIYDCKKTRKEYR